MCHADVCLYACVCVYALCLCFVSCATVCICVCFCVCICVYDCICVCVCVFLSVSISVSVSMPVSVSSYTSYLYFVSTKEPTQYTHCNNFVLLAMKPHQHTATHLNALQRIALICLIFS